MLLLPLPGLLLSAIGNVAGGSLVSSFQSIGATGGFIGMLFGGLLWFFVLFNSMVIKKNIM